MRRPPAALDSPSAKVIAVLDTVATRGIASVSAIAAELSIPTPTVHRIALELERLGYLQREPGSRQLTVSAPLVTLAANVLLAASASSPRRPSCAKSRNRSARCAASVSRSATRSSTWPAPNRSRT